MFVGGLLGIANSCVFFLLFGRGFRLFIPFLLLGTAAAIGGVVVAKQLPESGPMLGEVNILIASVATWLILFIARSLRV